MNSINMAFLLTTLAGLSTMLGVVPIFIKLKDENKIITASLAFAAGVMSCVSITDLIPESILMLENYYSGFITVVLVFLFLMIGIVVSSFIDKAFPSTPVISNSHVSLYKVGII